MRGCARAAGRRALAPPSCLVEQAKILVAEAAGRTIWDRDAGMRGLRGGSRSLCEQQYHGVVYGALTVGVLERRIWASGGERLGSPP